MNILNNILLLLLISLINIKDYSPIKQNIAEHIYNSIKYKNNNALIFKLKTSDNYFELTGINYGYLEYDQDDNDNSIRNKYLFIRILNFGKSKTIHLREKECLIKKRLYYFVLDLPPPLIS